MFHHFVYFLAYPILKIFYGVKIEGKSNIPRQGGLVVACNHESNVDPVMAGFSVFPRSPNYFAKQELFKIPLFSSFIRALGAFPVDREKTDRKALKKSIEILKNGGTLIMFPQGSRKADLKQAHDGAAYLAFKSGVPILPMAIIGTDKVMPPGSKFPKFSKILVKIGKPVSVNTIDKNALHDLTSQTMGQIIEMVKS
jgi:1-acyl-sn-glycerol-3-phosphate acyltransferase